MTSNPPPDEDLYADWRCQRCGICCGATDGHPCEHLQREGERYFCEIYQRRLGFHRTVDGLPFRCVSIRKLIDTLGGYPECAYVQELSRRRAQAKAP